MKHDRYEPMPVLAEVEKHIRMAEDFAARNSRGQFAREIRVCISAAVREIDDARAFDRLPQ